MFQKCPVCNGEGKVESKLNDLMLDVCGVCCGKKIISELNGLPPGDNKKVFSKKYPFNLEKPFPNLKNSGFFNDGGSQNKDYRSEDKRIYPYQLEESFFIKDILSKCTHQWTFGEKNISCRNCGTLAEY